MVKKHYYTSDYGSIHSDNTYTTPTGRCSFPCLAERRAPMQNRDGTPGVPKHELTLLIPKNSPGLDAFLDAVEEEILAMVAQYNASDKARNSKMTLAINTWEDFFKDGDLADLEKKPHHKNCWLLTARNKDTVDTFMRGEDGQAVSCPPTQFRGGNLARALVTPVVSATGLSFRLLGARWVGDDGVHFDNTSARARENRDILDDDIDTSSLPSIQGVQAEDQGGYEEDRVQPTAEDVQAMEASIEESFEAAVETPAPPPPAPRARRQAQAPAAQAPAPAPTRARTVATQPVAQAAPAKTTRVRSATAPQAAVVPAPVATGIVVTSQEQRQAQANLAVQEGTAGGYNDLAPNAPVVQATQAVQKVPTQARGGLGKASGLGRV